MGAEITKLTRLSMALRYFQLRKVEPNNNKTHTCINTVLERLKGWRSMLSKELKKETILRLEQESDTRVDLHDLTLIIRDKRI